MHVSFVDIYLWYRNRACVSVWHWRTIQIQFSWRVRVLQWRTMRVESKKFYSYKKKLSKFLEYSHITVIKIQKWLKKIGILLKPFVNFNHGFAIWLVRANLFSNAPPFLPEPITTLHIWRGWLRLTSIDLLVSKWNCSDKVLTHTTLYIIARSGRLICDIL